MPHPAAAISDSFGLNSPLREIAARGSRFDWRLRWAASSDLDGLHAVACQPAAYRYLFDGKAPTKELILGRIQQGMVDADRLGVGLRVLEGPNVRYGGCVLIEPDHRSRSAELLYFLDGAYWGQGLAARMAWTAIAQAFCTPRIDCVFAGADRPNQVSLAVMLRLRMTFRRDVQYPLGPGVEYAIHRDDPASKQCAWTVAHRPSSSSGHSLSGRIMALLQLTAVILDAHREVTYNLRQPPTIDHDRHIAKTPITKHAFCPYLRKSRHEPRVREGRHRK